MNFQINFHTLTKVSCSILLFLGCESNKCEPPKIAEEIQSIDQIASDIIAKKNELFIYNKVPVNDEIRFECGKNQLSENWNTIDSICLANEICSFYVNKDDDITFFLRSQSDFFSGRLIERKLYFSVSGNPIISNDDTQIRNRCCKKISDNTWYLEDEVIN
jgi:hypothetical protein